MKGSDAPFYTRERKAVDLGFKINFTKENVLKIKTLPEKNVDKRK